VYCPHCHKPIRRQTVDEVVDVVQSLPEGSRIKVLAPIIKGQKGEHRKVIQKLFKDGFTRIIVDGFEYTADEGIELEKNKKHDISAVIDRLVVKQGIRSRLAESLELAFQLGEGLVVIRRMADEGEEHDMLFSREFACSECGFSLPELSPRMFSFNSPFGACPECNGLGERREMDPDLVLDLDLSLEEGAIIPWALNSHNYYRQLVLGMSERYNIPMDKPLSTMSPSQLDLILYGNKGEQFKITYTNSYGETGTYYTRFEGVINTLKRRHHETKSDVAREEMEKFMTISLCPACRGKRLRPEILSVLLGEKNIAEVTAMAVHETLAFLSQLDLDQREALIARQIIKEITERLRFLIDVGLNYLTLDRPAGSLSGGEAQRIRLATQVGSSLVGVLYVLDEPSVGLHPRDNTRLLETLKRLRDLGNTVLVVEHDEETIHNADYIVDIGPGAGVHGGRVVATGSVQDLMQSPESITGQYLAGVRTIAIPPQRRSGNGQQLVIKGAREHNLKDLTVRIPLGQMVVITGVSGSGKSTLVQDILYPALMKRIHNSRYRVGAHDDIEGIMYLDKVINIDQSPIGRTPRSNPATYTGTFDSIRELFSETAEARVRGYKPGRFSFNVRGGRCEACAGDGIIKIEMHFLPDVYIPCEVCKGKRYNRETLEVKYKGQNIADVLAMTVDEGVEFFESIPRIERRLKVLQDVGLGYIQLGQPAPTLSGGEAQRVKLSTELAKRSLGRNLYILDEPTTGLHREDVKHLLAVLERLVDAGNSVIVVEHNLDVIKSADHIIDLGPEGGEEGGRIIAEGTPEEVAGCPASYTGQFLRAILDENSRRGN
jgi:excinuclease ABC subunit A